MVGPDLTLTIQGLNALVQELERLKTTSEHLVKEWAKRDELRSRIQTDCSESVDRVVGDIDSVRMLSLPISSAIYCVSVQLISSFSSLSKRARLPTKLMLF